MTKVGFWWFNMQFSSWWPYCCTVLILNHLIHGPCRHCQELFQLCLEPVPLVVHADGKVPKVAVFGGVVAVKWRDMFEGL